MDRIVPLTPDERWLADARSVVHQAAGYMVREVEMTHTVAWLERLRASGVPASVQHLIVRASALALARNPALHQIVCGYDRVMPAAVDVGLAVSAASTAPVVIARASERPLPLLVGAIDAALARAPRSEKRAFALLRNIDWLAPFGFLRRMWLRWLQDRVWFRRRVAGTFQVAYAPGADVVVPLRINTGSALGAGRVRDVVVPVAGKVQVHKRMTITLVADHVAMDGVRMATLLNAIGALLEGEELEHEALATAAS
jgi:hypothetical protein